MALVNRVLTVAFACLFGCSVSAKTADRAEVRRFLAEAYQGSLAEVSLGKLATERSKNVSVQHFGNRMVSDHTNMASQLNALAENQRLSLPTEIPEKHRKLYDSLKHASSDQFDRSYMSAMKRDHEEDLEKFRSYATAGKDPEARELAKRMVPILESHLLEAERLLRLL